MAENETPTPEMEPTPEPMPEFPAEDETLADPPEEPATETADN